MAPFHPLQIQTVPRELKPWDQTLLPGQAPGLAWDKILLQQMQSSALPKDVLLHRSLEIPDITAATCNPGSYQSLAALTLEASDPAVWVF